MSLGTWCIQVLATNSSQGEALSGGGDQMGQHPVWYSGMSPFVKCSDYVWSVSKVYSIALADNEPDKVVSSWS